jgi:Ca-activated chloride channel family protein
MILIGGILILFAALSMAHGATPTSASRGAPETSGTNGETTDSAVTLLLPTSSSTDGFRQSWTLAKSIFPGYTIRRTVPEVRLQFSVADEHGRLVTNLSPSDLRLFDNQSAVLRIHHFSRLEDLPLQLGILLDVSDSVQKTASREKLATQFFVQHVLQPQTDRAFLMAFAANVKLWQPSTGDLPALRQTLERIQQLGYATNLYDGLFSACLGQFPETNGPKAAQRIIVLFSDGDDTGSLHGIRDVVALAQRNEIQIFALSIHARRKSTTGDEVLQRLADETGGQFYVAASDKEFSAIFTEMEQQMRTQYAVSFQPQQETAGFHALRLELAGPQKMRVHARQGYYFEAP